MIRNPLSRSFRTLIFFFAGILSPVLYSDDAGQDSPVQDPVYEVHVQAQGISVQESSTLNTLDAYRRAMGRCEKEAARRKHAGLCEPVSIDGEVVSSAVSLRANTARNLSLFQIHGGRAQVFVFGSIHVMKPGIYPLNEQILQAFASAQTLVLEVSLADLDDKILNQAFSVRGYYEDGTTLQRVLPEKVQDNLADVFSRRGLDSSAFATMRPWFLEQSIVNLEASLYGYSAEYGIDMFFETRARKLGKEILELETLEQQLDLLSDSSLQEQVLSLQYTLEYLLEKSVQSELDSLVSDWLRGDIESLYIKMLDVLQTYPALKPALERMFDDRNRAMAEKIAAWLQGDGSYFVVVGAGHLGGEQGLIRLLEDKGYRVEQIQRAGATPEVWSN